MRTDKLTSIVAVSLAILYWIATENIMEPPIGDPIGPKAIPRLLACGLVLSAVLLWFEAQSNRKSRKSDTDAASEIQKTNDEAARPLFIAILVLGTAIYLSVFTWLGYPIATGIYLLLLMLFFNPSKTWMNVGTAVGFSLVSYLVFTRIFGAQLPTGMLPF